MQSPEEAQEWAAVAVSPSRTETSPGADDVVESVIDAHGVAVKTVGDLGAYRGERASEWLFDATPELAASVRHDIANAVAQLADVAVLPVANRRKRLLISDMDSTIIGQECLDELADFAGLKADVSAITDRAMRGELDFEQALTTRVAMLNGLSLSALQACYNERIRLTPGADTLVATMKAMGAQTVLVSGGFTFFTERVAAAAGFHAHRGNTLLDDGARLTGEVGRPILGREAKLEILLSAAAEAGLTADDAVALGDGANDLAMIQAAGLGLAYRAKPVVAADADAAILQGSVVAALFFQGIPAHAFVTP